MGWGVKGVAGQAGGGGGGGGAGALGVGPDKGPEFIGGDPFGETFADPSGDRSGRSTPTVRMRKGMPAPGQRLKSGIARIMKSSKSGTVNAMSPWAGL